jgi:hypothetical protein
MKTCKKSSKNKEVSYALLSKEFLPKKRRKVKNLGKLFKHRNE